MERIRREYREKLLDIENAFVDKDLGFSDTPETVYRNANHSINYTPLFFVFGENLANQVGNF